MCMLVSSNPEAEEAIVFANEVLSSLVVNLHNLLLARYYP
jgi:hypothetical protein